MSVSFAMREPHRDLEHICWGKMGKASPGTGTIQEGAAPHSSKRCRAKQLPLLPTQDSKSGSPKPLSELCHLSSGKEGCSYKRSLVGLHIAWVTGVASVRQKLPCSSGSHGQRLGLSPPSAHMCTPQHLPPYRWAWVPSLLPVSSPSHSYLLHRSTACRKFLLR